MLIPVCHIQIADKEFTSVNELVIKRSIYNLSARALIKVPVTAVLKQAGKPAAKTETAKQIKVEDPVTIKLGYNNDLQIEFVGYVKQLNYKIPLEIECEDEYYQTRFVDCVFSKKETTLKQCLNTLLPKIELAHCIDLTLKNFAIKHKPGSWLLGLLKKEYGLTIFFDMNGKLYVGKAFDVQGETVKYQLRYNVIKDDNLKFQLAQDIKLKVKAVCFQTDGTKIEGELGTDGGEQKTLYYYDVKDAKQLKELANAELKKYSYDGYRGKIETFLIPYCLPGMVAAIDDPVYNERNGNYYIESVEVTFGQDGARRKVEIGIKV